MLFLEFIKNVIFDLKGTLEVKGQRMKYMCNWPQKLYVKFDENISNCFQVNLIVHLTWWKDRQTDKIGPKNLFPKHFQMHAETPIWSLNFELFLLKSDKIWRKTSFGQEVKTKQNIYIGTPDWNLSCLRKIIADNLNLISLFTSLVFWRIRYLNLSCLRL